MSLETTTENLEKIVDHERYEITDDVLGRGCWGVVYKARDNYLDRDVAIKVLAPNEIAKKQMKERKLDTIKAMQKEAGKFAACSNIVPRWFDIDKKGNPFLVMPIYERDFADVIGENGYKSYFGNGLTLNKTVKYLRDIANAFSESHTRLKRAHGDPKPENFAVDENDIVLLNDFGTSTVASVDMMSKSPRDNMGFLHTRAIECFKNGSHPDKRSDVWSFGSLAYRLFTGKYPLEEEVNSVEDGEDYIRNLDEKTYNKIINRKIKDNVPRKFRKLLRKSLSYDSFDRFKDGNELKQELESVIENLDNWNIFKNYTRKIGIPATLLGLFIYGASTHEPTELTMPKLNFNGPIYSGLELEEEPLRFDREDLDLPEPVIVGVEHNVESIIKHVSDNGYVAYLLKTYKRAASSFGNIFTGFSFYNDNQAAIYATHSNGSMSMGPLSMIAKSIEYGLNKSKTPEGTIDLEDACAISRLGLDKVNEARRAVDSFEFKDYIEAKDSKGDYIIPEVEQKFLKIWLSYIN